MNKQLNMPLSEVPASARQADVQPRLKQLSADDIFNIMRGEFSNSNRIGLLQPGSDHLISEHSTTPPDSHSHKLEMRQHPERLNSNK
jgi:hypothetical protein